MVQITKKRGACIGCSCCVVTIGIVCLVLGLRGYLTFEEPTISPLIIVIESFGMDIPLDGGDIIPDNLSDLNFKAPSIGMTLTTEFVNPNTYDITLEQKGEGTIVIPACIIMNETSSGDCANLENMIIPPDSPDDLMIGNWVLPVTVLEAKSSTNITVILSHSINLNDLSADQYNYFYDLAKSMSVPLLLRVRGGVKVSSWFPGDASATFDCLAEWEADNLADVSAKMPVVKCNIDVMNMIAIDGVVVPV
jgi:hypothetical protein